MPRTSARALLIAIIAVFCSPILMQHASDKLEEHVYTAQTAPEPTLSAGTDSEPDAPIDAALLHALAASCKQTPATCAEYSAALRRVGRVAEARRAAEKALLRGPALWPLWTSMGLLLAADGDTMAARCVPLLSEQA
jgi:hypothetical protein